jgi:acetyl esterase/lipase
MTYAYDPEVATFIPLLPDEDDLDPLRERALISGLVADMPPPDTAGIDIEDRLIPGRDGDPGVPIRTYRPEQAVAPAAAVYDVHGGGFVAGDIDLDHQFNVMLARELRAVVVSVDYRLAPETPFPGGLEDVYAGLVWTAGHADELGIDPRRIAIHGISAGGGLCAALALLARDRGGPHIAFQLLGVPELDDRLTTPSMTEFVDTPLWNRPKAIGSWDFYLGPGRAGGKDVSVYAAPSRATNLAGLPPAYVSVMEFDPLRDEGIAYAQALLAAGVSVELHLFPGTFHGSRLAQDALVSHREMAETMAVLRKALSLS